MRVVMSVVKVEFSDSDESTSHPVSVLSTIMRIVLVFSCLGRTENQIN